MSGFHNGKPVTILGAKKLNFCVRYGNRWVLLALITTPSYCSLKTK